MTNPFLSADGSTEVAGYPYGPAEPVLCTQASHEPLDASAPQTWFPLVLLALFLLADFVISPVVYVIQGPIAWQECLVVAILGVIGAQAAVLSAWLVWGEGLFFWRLLIHWGVAAVFCWVWIAGLATCAKGSELSDGHCIAALSLAIVSAAIQAPLWLVRQAFGWRLVREGTVAASAREKPSTIGNLMLAMSIAAVAAAFARIVPTGLVGSEFAAMWSVVVAVAAGISLLAILPLAFWLLWQRSVGLGLLFTFFYAQAAIVIFWLIVVAVNTTVIPDVKEMVISSVMIDSFAFMLTLSALAARGMGYRLLIGQRGAASG